jgi:DNA (cytosine-5)-methyltransferase 1
VGIVSLTYGATRPRLLVLFCGEGGAAAGYVRAGWHVTGVDLGGYVPASRSVKQALLGIDWMTVRGMQESIPPAYAEWVGRQLLAHVTKEAVA